MRTSAITRGAHAVGNKVTPAARAFTEGTRRLVGYAGQAADDATLVAKVKAALIMRKGLDEGEIRVHAEEGVVRLTGRVSSMERKRAAGDAARNTVGVSKVDNRLAVAASASASGG